MMMNKALPYDAEIEYLKSTGTQWIRLLPRTLSVATLIFEITAKFDSIPSQYMGSGYSSLGSSQAYYAIQRKNNGLYACFANKTTNFAMITVDDPIGWHTFRCVVENGKSYYFIDDNLVHTADTSIFSFSYFSLFGITDANGRITGLIGGSISNAYLNVNSEDIFKCKSVRIDTTGYMYDKVSGQLFGNAGTGDFILGADK